MSWCGGTTWLHSKNSSNRSCVKRSLLCILECVSHCVWIFVQSCKRELQSVAGGRELIGSAIGGSFLFQTCLGGWVCNWLNWGTVTFIWRIVNVSILRVVVKIISLIKNEILNRSLALDIVLVNQNIFIIHFKHGQAVWPQMIAIKRLFDISINSFAVTV